MEQHFSFASLVIPVVIIALTVVGLGLLITVSRNYKKVSPNEVAVVSGRKHRYTTQDGKPAIRGYRIIMGGGYFLYPVVEKVDTLWLSNMSLGISVKSAPDINGALVSVTGVAQVKIKSDEASLMLAIERFLGKTPTQIAETAQQTLEGSLRAIVGTLSIEKLIGDRAELQKKILSEATADLAKLGLDVDVLTVQGISDERGYIESLGKKRTAEVVRDATIGEAEAHRDSQIRSAQATREGEVAEANAKAEISDAQRARDTKIADNSAAVQAQQARIPIIAQTAAATEQRTLNVAQVAAKQAQVEAETNLQVAERKRHDAELEATIIVKAEREKDAKIIAAEAEQQSATQFGEALRIKAEKEGQGTQAKLTAESEGRKKAAEALQAELTAQAAGDRAKLEATAAGEKAMLLARAEGQRALLLAEAEGTLKKAQAFKELDEAGRFLMILQALPPVVDAIGGAIKEIMVPTAEAIGKGLGNVDEIRIIDLGGNNGTNGNPAGSLTNFTKLPVETIFGLVEKLKATGMAPVVIETAKRAGIDLTAVFAGAPSLTAPKPAPDTPATDTAATS